MLDLLGSGYAADGHMVPTRRKPGRRALLDGNFARRKLPLRETEYCIWDTELTGFGLRVRPTGTYYWFVRLRHRGKHRRIASAGDLAAPMTAASLKRIVEEALAEVGANVMHPANLGCRLGAKEIHPCKIIT